MIYIYVILCILIIVIILILYINRKDLFINQDDKLTIPKLYYCTFYTDNLKDIMYEHKTKVEPYVDNFYAFNKNDIINLGGDKYVRAFSDEHILKPNPGLHRMQFGAYKPFILLYLLKNAKENDIIIFRDVNIKKYPAYITEIENIKETAKYIQTFNKQNIVMPIEENPQKNNKLLKNLCRKKVLDMLSFNDNIKNYQCLGANIIIVKKSSVSIKHLQEWAELCLNDELLSPITGPDEEDDFMHHCPEQALFSIMMANKSEQGIVEKNYPGVYMTNRTFSKNHIFEYKISK